MGQGGMLFPAVFLRKICCFGVFLSLGMLSGCAADAGRELADLAASFERNAPPPAPAILIAAGPSDGAVADRLAWTLTPSAGPSHLSAGSGDWVASGPQTPSAESGGWILDKPSTPSADSGNWIANAPRLPSADSGTLLEHP